MQAFLGGCIRGRLVRDSDTSKGAQQPAVVERRRTFSETDAASSAQTESLRNHIVFIFEIARLQEVIQDMYEERAGGKQMVTGSVETVEQLARSVPLPDILLGR